MKPYDLEQAKEEVSARAKNAGEAVKREIERAVEEAIERLRIESETFTALPADLSTLLTQAVEVVVTEIRPPKDAVDAGRPIGVRFDNMRLMLERWETWLPMRPDGIRFPPGNYRMITIFMPVKGER